MGFTVKDMIDALEKIDNKDLPICIDDWNEQYKSPAIVGNISVYHECVYFDDSGRAIGDFVCIETKD